MAADSRSSSSRVEHGWVALLRAVNLGRRNAVPMARLRKLLEELGCSDVRTYIQSGNVLFGSRRSGRGPLGKLLESAIADEFGVSTVVVLRDFQEMARVARSHPFGDDTSRSHVVFLAAEPSAAAVRGLARLAAGSDEYKIVGTEVFLRYPSGTQAARLTGAVLERHLGVAGTTRNWRTVERLAELALADPV